MSFGALGKKIKRTNRSLYEGNKNDNNFRREREKEYDYKLMESRKWLNTAFDGVNIGVKLNEITPEDVPEVMLMGMTRTNISPKGE